MTAKELSKSGAPDNAYRYNGKELDEATGLYDYGARYYDPAIARWGQVDPLADQYAPYSPYNYVLGNPIRLVDPDGRSVDGDIYNLNGVHVGNDGKEDNMVYILDSTDDGQMSQESALALTNAANTLGPMNPTPAYNLTAIEGITHDQFEQFAANVYNEAPYETSAERDKVASAISNRKETHSLGGDWQQTLDRIMFAKDNHQSKMTEARANPAAGSKIPGTRISMNNVKTGHYQEFINTAPTDRNDNPRMQDVTRATVRTLNGGSDQVNGANEWRGRGQGRGNRFFKERR